MRKAPETQPSLPGFEPEPAIERFSGRARFLSNFYPSIIEFEGQRYPTVEHAFQAAKTSDPKLRKRIREAGTPGTAKALGRKVPLRQDWERVKLDVMLGFLRKKFGHSMLRDLLLGTGTAKLVEGNTWNDTFWGVVDGRGRNHLGRLLMQVRDELRQKPKKK